MSTLENRQDGWKECSPGTLGLYAKRQKLQILKRRLMGIGGVASICLLVALTWKTFLPKTTENTNSEILIEPNYGGIVCSNVKAVAKAHLAGTLDANTTQRIELHLQECALCRSFLKQLGNGQASKSSFRTYHERNVSFSSVRDSQTR